MNPKDLREEEEGSCRVGCARRMRNVERIGERFRRGWGRAKGLESHRVRDRNRSSLFTEQNMSLRELNLKPVYYSDQDNLLTNFYLPVLSNSIKYDRIAGCFCSNALAIAAKGICNFISNGGRIRLIAREYNFF